jgi:hypothetical protein
MLNLNLINELLKYSFFYYLHDVSVRAWLQKNTKHLLRLTDYVVHTFCIIYEYQKLIRTLETVFKVELKYLFIIYATCVQSTIYLYKWEIYIHERSGCVFYLTL